MTTYASFLLPGQFAPAVRVWELASISGWGEWIREVLNREGLPFFLGISGFVVLFRLRKLWLLWFAVSVGADGPCVQGIE